MRKIEVGGPASVHLSNEDMLVCLLVRHWGTDTIHWKPTHDKLISWDKHMARKTYRIELKMDFEDDANHAILLDIAKQYARDLLGSAMLLQDGRKPAVALMTDDSFFGIEEIDLLKQSENVHTAENTISP